MVGEGVSGRHFALTPLPADPCDSASSEPVSLDEPRRLGWQSHARSRCLGVNRAQGLVTTFEEECDIQTRADPWHLALNRRRAGEERQTEHDPDHVIVDDAAMHFAECAFQGSDDNVRGMGQGAWHILSEKSESCDSKRPE